MSDPIALEDISSKNSDETLDHNTDEQAEIKKTIEGDRHENKANNENQKEAGTFSPTGDVDEASESKETIVEDTTVLDDIVVDDENPAEEAEEAETAEEGTEEGASAAAEGPVVETVIKTSKEESSDGKAKKKIEKRKLSTEEQDDLEELLQDVKEFFPDASVSKDGKIHISVKTPEALEKLKQLIKVLEKKHGKDYVKNLENKAVELEKKFAANAAYFGDGQIHLSCQQKENGLSIDLKTPSSVNLNNEPLLQNMIGHHGTFSHNGVTGNYLTLNPNSVQDLQKVQQFLTENRHKLAMDHGMLNANLQRIEQQINKLKTADPTQANIANPQPSPAQTLKPEPPRPSNKPAPPAPKPLEAHVGKDANGNILLLRNNNPNFDLKKAVNESAMKNAQYVAQGPGHVFIRLNNETDVAQCNQFLQKNAAHISNEAGARQWHENVAKNIEKNDNRFIPDAPTHTNKTNITLLPTQRSIEKELAQQQSQTPAPAPQAQPASSPMPSMKMGRI